MGWTKKTNGKKNGYKKPYSRAYGTNKFMSKGLAIKRYNQVSTKTFYFKGNGTLQAGAGGLGFAAWSTRTRISPPPPATSYLTPGVPADFLRISRCYNSYKILCIKLILYPANVGTESDLPGISTNPFQRGNCVTYFEQDMSRNQQLPTLITQVMNFGSAKMFVPRNKHERTLYRPKGYPEWGQCDSDTPQSSWRLDPWWGALFWMINNGTANGPPISYYQVEYKVIFRGRNKSPGGGITGVEDGYLNPEILLDI